MTPNWLPIRCDLHDDPAVIAIAAATGTDEFAVVGRLVRLWAWANEQLANGNAPGVTFVWIDRYLSCAGFAEAMVKAGWLVQSDHAIEFPKFDVWNSQGAKKRLENAKRVRKHRYQCNAEIVTPVAHTALPRERERERDNNTPLPPTGGVVKSRDKSKFDPSAVDLPHPSPAFRSAWADWVRHRAEKRERLTPTTTAKQLKALAALTEADAIACIERSVTNGWTGLFPDKGKSAAAVAPPTPIPPPLPNQHDYGPNPRTQAAFEARMRAKQQQGATSEAGNG